MPVKLYMSHFVDMVVVVDMGDRRLEMVTIYSFGRIEPSNSSKIYFCVTFQLYVYPGSLLDLSGEIIVFKYILTFINPIIYFCIELHLTP